MSYKQLLLQFLWRNYKTISWPKLSSPDTNHGKEDDRNVKQQKKRDVWGASQESEEVWLAATWPNKPSLLSCKKWGFCLTGSSVFHPILVPKSMWLPIEVTIKVIMIKILIATTCEVLGVRVGTNCFISIISLNFHICRRAELKSLQCHSWGTGTQNLRNVLNPMQVCLTSELTVLGTTPPLSTFSAKPRTISCKKQVEMVRLVLFYNLLFSLNVP